MQIKVGAFNYNCEETGETLIVDHNECGGIINFENLSIKIKEDLNVQRKKQTILHEVFHAILREYQIDIGEVDEEYLVDILGTAMYQIIKDNNKLIDYIFNKRIGTGV